MRATVIFTAWLLVLLLLGGYSAGAAAPAAETCGFRTYTQEDYGKANNGNTPYAYVKAHFPQVFPAGLTVGCASGHTLKLTSAGAVVNFLPGTGSTPQALTASYTNPYYYNLRLSQTGAFAGQVVALALSVGFDLADASFASAGTALGDAVVTSGPLAGKTVAFVLAQANLAVGGCTSAYSVAQLNTVVTAINQGYAGGQASTLLSCSAACAVAPPGAAAAPTYCQGAAASPLSSGYTAAAGASLRLYSSATAGTPLAGTYAPATAAVGTTTYYAAQVVGSCESARTPLAVTVVAPPGTPAPVAALAIDGTNIAAWGDSFTDANYGRYPQTLAQLSGYAVYNGGIGGQTSVQIKDRMVADAAKHTWPTIIWAGRNDMGNPAQVQASVAAMVAALTHTDYLVLSVCNGEGEGTGTAAYGQMTTLDNALAQTYGSHYLNVRSYLVAQYNPNDAQDVADHAADIPPNSLRQDFLHPNVAGSDLIAHYIYANFGRILSGSVALNYCQGASAAPLGNSLGPVAAGAAFRFYTSPSAGTALGTGPGYAPATGAVGTQMYYVAQAVGTCESSRLPLAVVVSSCADPSASAARGRPAGPGANGPELTAKPAPALASDAPALSAYPNPFGGQATVEVNLPPNQSYTLELYNGTGALVQRLAAGAAGQRAHYFIDAPSLPSGLYVVRLSAGPASQNLRLLLSK